jgi:hypothetical protein
MRGIPQGVFAGDQSSPTIPSTISPPDVAGILPIPHVIYTPLLLRLEFPKGREHFGLLGISY